MIPDRALATAPLSDEADVVSLDAALDRIKAAVGPSGWLGPNDDVAPYLAEQRGLYHGRTLLVVRPGTVDEVAEVVKACASAGIAIVPQGGNTGLCGAAVPLADHRNIVVSLGRMRRIRSIDPGNFAITVEAGCVLADIQAAADAHDRLFPLSLGAEGSCQIGGNLSTNAGGMQVLRYGNARELTLGVEVVLPDGRVLDCLRALRKDNTGYDLKHLFIGAEGTLGVVTAATLRLFPKPLTRATAYAAVPTLDALIDLLALARAHTGDQLTVFEFMPRFGVDIAVRHVADVRDPLPGTSPWYVLMEVSSSAPGSRLDETVESLLSVAMERGLISDAAVAASEQQRTAMWRVREGLVAAQRHEGGSIKFDVSVPVTAIPAFVPRAIDACRRVEPGVRPLAFGHCGDGNVHFNLTAPVGDQGAFMGLSPRFDDVVFDLVTELGGSISAEHGIGISKRAALARYKSATELDVMRRMKAALDPMGLLNPGKVLPAGRS
jgi:FAD/FMN-containing dehydrogenase